jgi:hypothetical protein
MKRVTLGGNKNYDTREFVWELRRLKITPHVAQNNWNRKSALDERSTRHAVRKNGLAIHLRGPCTACRG